MCQHSHFWSFISRQKREEHFGLFYKFHWRLQTPAVSGTLHAFQKMSRSGEEGGRGALVVFGGGLGWQNAFSLSFFPFLLFALDLSALISPLLSHRQQKYAEGERLSGRKNTSKHCEALWSHFCSKQLPFLAIIPGFVHRKGEWGVGGFFYNSGDRDVKINPAVS